MRLVVRRLGSDRCRQIEDREEGVEVALEPGHQARVTAAPGLAKRQ